MAQNPVRTPDGHNNISTGSAQVQQPTIVSFRTNGELLETPGKGMVFLVGTNYPSIDVYGFGFDNLDIQLVPSLAVPPVTPIGITNISRTAESGVNPGVIDFELDPSTPVLANIGQYFLVATDLVTGLRDLIPVRIYNAV